MHAFNCVALKAKKAAQAQAMREARAANFAAEKERKEKLRLARAERAAAAAAKAAAAKAAAKVAEAEAAEASAAEASAAEQEGPFADAGNEVHAGGLNGYAQHPQHAQLTAGAADFRNGYHLLQSLAVQHQGKNAGFNAHSPTAAEDPEVDIMHSTPEKAAAATASGGGGAGPSVVDIIHSASQEAQLKGSKHNPYHQLNNLQNTALQESNVGVTHASPFGLHGGQSRPWPRTAPHVESMLVSDALHRAQHQRRSSPANSMADQSEQIEEQQRSASASEPDFDWAAWQSPEDGPRGDSS